MNENLITTDVQNIANIADVVRANEPTTSSAVLYTTAKLKEKIKNRAKGIYFDSETSTLTYCFPQDNSPISAVIYPSFQKALDIKNVVFIENGQTDPPLSLPVGLFSKCSNLQNVDLGNCLSHIPSSCFSSCTNLVNINLSHFPASNDLTIDNAAFSGAGLAGTVSFSGKEVVSNGITFSGLRLILNGAPFAFSQITKFIVPCRVQNDGTTTTYIGSQIKGSTQRNAFGGSKLSKVWLPSQTEIEGQPFWGCPSTCEIYTDGNGTEWESGWNACASGKTLTTHYNAVLSDVTEG